MEKDERIQEQFREGINLTEYLTFLEKKLFFTYLEWEILQVVKDMKEVGEKILGRIFELLGCKSEIETIFKNDRDLMRLSEECVKLEYLARNLGTHFLVAYYLVEFANFPSYYSGFCKMYENEVKRLIEISYKVLGMILNMSISEEDKEKRREAHLEIYRREEEFLLKMLEILNDNYIKSIREIKQLQNRLYK